MSTAQQRCGQAFCALTLVISFAAHTRIPTHPPPIRAYVCSNAVEDPDGDRYFRPFQLACENKNYKIKALALDVIEKMIGASCAWLRRATRSWDAAPPADRWRL